MIQYPALLDGGEGAYGIIFPDIPGVGAMGHTVDEALLNAEAVLRDYAVETEKDGEQLTTPSPLHSIEIPAGNQLVSLPLIRLSDKRVRAGLTLDDGFAELVDSEALQRGMTR